MTTQSEPAHEDDYLINDADWADLTQNFPLDDEAHALIEQALAPLAQEARFAPSKGDARREDVKQLRNGIKRLRSAIVKRSHTTKLNYEREVIGNLMTYLDELERLNEYRPRGRQPKSGLYLTLICLEAILLHYRKLPLVKSGNKNSTGVFAAKACKLVYKKIAQETVLNGIEQIVKFRSNKKKNRSKKTLSSRANAKRKTDYDRFVSLIQHAFISTGNIWSVLESKEFPRLWSAFSRSPPPIYPFYASDWQVASGARPYGISLRSH